MCTEKKRYGSRKKYVFLIGAGAPVIVAFLYAWNYMRVETTLSGISLKEMFLGFFNSKDLAQVLSDWKNIMKIV